MTLKINEIWAFVSVGTNGDEGICSYYDREHNAVLPLVVSTQKRVNALYPLAANISLATGRIVKLRRFKACEEVDALEPTN